MGTHGAGNLYRARGRGKWRVRWMSNGQLHDVSTGTEDYEEAKKVAQRKTACFAELGDVKTLTAQLEKAKDRQAYLEARTNPSLTLFRMVYAFRTCDIVRRKKNSKRTLDAWIGYGNLLIDHFGGNTEMRMLKREDVEAFMREYEKKVSATRFNDVLRFFKRAWDVLSKYDSPEELKARLPSESPWRYILPMKRNAVVGKRPFTPEQLNRIWRVLEKMDDPDMTLLFDLARNTGARLHDLVSWKWDDLTFNLDSKGKPQATLEWKPMKTINSTGKLMVIPILDQRVVMELIKRSKAREAGQEYILPRMLEIYNRGNGSGTHLTRLCQRVFKRAGLETTQKVEGNSRANCVYGIHSFRHTLVSELFNKGVDLGTIQHLYTGHSSAFVTELYSHADMEKKILDLSKLAPIETGKKKPDGFQTFIGMMNDADREEYDRIKTSDIPKKVANQLISLLWFKSKEELTIIRDWIDRRIKAL